MKIVLILTWTGKKRAINWKEMILEEMAVFSVKHLPYHVFYVEADNGEFYLTSYKTAGVRTIKTVISWSEVQRCTEHTRYYKTMLCSPINTRYFLVSRAGNFSQCFDKYSSIRRRNQQGWICCWIWLEIRLYTK